MDNNGKINRGIDLGTTNSAIAVMENGVPVIKKSQTQKDTTPSVVSINRKQVIHVGDTAANEMAQQIIDFIETNIDVDTLLVHCFAGQSRSRAVAAFAVEMMGGDSSIYLEQGGANMYVYDTLLVAWMQRALA